jgi:hypothetical protein
MIRSHVTKRLERLERRILPPRVKRVIKVVFVDTDGTTVGGFTVGPANGDQAPGGADRHSGRRDEWGDMS